MQAMVEYNLASHREKNGYSAQIHLRGDVFAEILELALQSLPDEILIGLDIGQQSPVQEEVEEAFFGIEQKDGLFGGQGFIIDNGTLVNRGDELSVHHLPEEWTDGLFSQNRGSRGGRFDSWLHTHPNAPAVPSEADATAASENSGVEMILGIRFSPEGPLGWYDDVEGTRRSLGREASQSDLTGKENKEDAGLRPKRSFSSLNKRRRRRRVQEQPVLGRANTGHLIHGLELIAFHRSGLGVNVILVDKEGLPYGWENIKERESD